MEITSKIWIKQKVIRDESKYCSSIFMVTLACFEYRNSEIDV